MNTFSSSFFLLSLEVVLRPFKSRNYILANKRDFGYAKMVAHL